jgi:hypothetical protein
MVDAKLWRNILLGEHKLAALAQKEPAKGKNIALASRYGHRNTKRKALHK